MSSHGIISAQPSVAVPISVKLQNLEHQLLLSCTSKSIVHFSAERGLLTLRQTCSQEIPGSAVCVQKFDDSLGFAIRPTYRISLRSSSLWEPRHPSLKVVFHFFTQRASSACYSLSTLFLNSDRWIKTGDFVAGTHCLAYLRKFSGACISPVCVGCRSVASSLHCLLQPTIRGRNKQPKTVQPHIQGPLRAKRMILDRCGNDPSAGSPTETLLRLHLPLSDKV